MPVNVRELLEATAILTEQENMRVTLKSSARGAFLVAITTFVGGIIAGPLGLAAGGTIGGFTAAYTSKSFKSVSQVIREDLTERQRNKLYEDITNAIRQVDATDLALLLPLLMGGSGAVQKAVLQTVATFVTNEMQMAIVD